MIAKAIDGEYDVIVVEKFDRFFRDDIEDRRYTRMLEAKGVLVVSALEGIDTSSASGKLLRWILSDINWFQREYMKEERSVEYHPLDTRPLKSKMANVNVKSS